MYIRNLILKISVDLVLEKLQYALHVKRNIYRGRFEFASFFNSDTGYMKMYFALNKMIAHVNSVFYLTLALMRLSQFQATNKPTSHPKRNIIQ